MNAEKTKRITRRSAIAGGLVLTAAACSSGSDTINISDGGLAAPAPQGDAPAPDSEAVDFNYVTFEGDEVVFSNFSDQPVVLNFFASWCPTCIAELPDFQTVSQNLEDEVQFLGLARPRTVQKRPTSSSRTPACNFLSGVTPTARFSTYFRVLACQRPFLLTPTALLPMCTLAS